MDDNQDALSSFDETMEALNNGNPVENKTVEVEETPVENIEGEVLDEVAEPEAVIQPEKKDVAIQKDSAIFDINSLPDSVKTQWEEREKRLAEAETERRHLRHKVIPALQREMSTLQARKQSSAAKAPDAKPETPQPSVFNRQPKWKNHRELYPEEAELIEGVFNEFEHDIVKKIADLEERNAQLSRRFEQDVEPRLHSLDQIRQEREQQEFVGRQQTLSEKYPDWDKHVLIRLNDRKEIDDVEFSEPMQNWLDQQPDEIVQMVYSSNPKACIRLFDLFTRDTQAPEPTTPIIPAQTTQQASQIHNARQKNLASRAVSGTQGVGVVKVGNSSLNSLDAFDLEMARLNSKR